MKKQTYEHADPNGLESSFSIDSTDILVQSHQFVPCQYTLSSIILYSRFRNHFFTRIQYNEHVLKYDGMGYNGTVQLDTESGHLLHPQFEISEQGLNQLQKPVLLIYTTKSIDTFQL